MSIFHTAASTQYLVNSTPVTLTLPFSVGMWINLTAIGTVNRILWAYSSRTTTDNYHILRMITTEEPAICTRASGLAESQIGCGGILAAGRWTFIVGRFIGPSDRTIHAISTGLTTALSYTSGRVGTTRNPTGLDTITIGVLSTSGGITEPWDGMIAEYWLASGDVFTDSVNHAQFGDATRRLAFGGPFSFPHLVPNIIEYYSFRKGPPLHAVGASAIGGAELGDTFNGPLGPQPWVNTNGVSLGPHPSLPYWYRRPSDYSRKLVV